MERQPRDSKGSEGPSDYIDGTIGATGPQYQSIGRTTDKAVYPEYPTYLTDEIKRLRSTENKLRKEINKSNDDNKMLIIENTKLGENLNNYIDNKFSSLITNILSVVFISIGASIVSTNLQSMLGWAFIITGLILYIVSIRAWEYL